MLVSLAMATRGNFILYVLDHQDKKLAVIDTKPVQEWCKELPYKKYARHIIQWTPKYMAAMNVHIPRWNHDVFAWNFSRAEGVANDVDGYVPMKHFCK